MKSATQKNKNWKEFGKDRWRWLPQKKRLKLKSGQRNKRGNAVRLQREKPRWLFKGELRLNKRTPLQLKKLMKLKCNVKLRSSDAKRNARQHRRSLWSNSV